VPRFVQQLQTLWSGLSLRQKTTVLLSALLAGAGLWALQRWSVERDFRPVYSEMTNEEAGAVVARLRGMNVPYRLDATGTTVLVPAARVAETRLQLASSGLPRNGRLGFELFDQTRFGATEFAEQINYRRALEGELERSVLSLQQVEQARVHISLPKESIFTDYQQPAKASVVVQLRRNQPLHPEQVRGIGFLVASAVEGLSPDWVSVIDVAGNLLTRPRRPGAESAEELELQQRIEREIAQKILHTVEPYLGPGKARASVSAEIETNAGEQTEEVLDPNPVTMTTQKSEEESQPSWTAGPPGTTSNVPRAAPRPASGGSLLTRKQENTTYQVSRTVTRMRLEKGAVKRLSVAVVVDHRSAVDEKGAPTRSARSPEEMRMIRDLVVAAAGILETRGDLLTIENLPFQGPASPVRESAPALPPGSPLRDLLRRIFTREWLVENRYVTGGILAVLLAAVAGLVVWRTAKRRTAVVAATPPPEVRMEKQLADREAAQRLADEAALLDLKMPQVTSNKAMLLRKVLADTAKKDPSSAVQLLRSWIHENET
jgi:flagellar M-ring protein FliF